MECLAHVDVEVVIDAASAQLGDLVDLDVQVACARQTVQCAAWGEAQHAVAEREPPGVGQGPFM